MTLGIAVAAACIAGMLALSLGIDAVHVVQRWRRRRRPPGTTGELRLVNEDGKQVLHALLPAAGLQHLLREYIRGRLD